MRTASILSATAALLAATACTIVQGKPAQPAPEARRAPSTAATLGIPPGHLPKPGQCRVWVPGKPPGHQARSRTCAGIDRTAPAGSWVVHRPDRDRKLVYVRMMDPRRQGLVVRIRVFDAERGTLVREG